MSTDKITKLLLTLIALALWFNILMSSPIVEAQSQSSDYWLGTYLPMIKANTADLPQMKQDTAFLRVIQAQTAYLPMLQHDTAFLPGMAIDLAYIKKDVSYLKQNMR